ncbi:DUF4030 domain-containing protein [Rossellomorea sp. BNER]|uniref:DUF4030 domain-containing protein n=1 Tax=Rossellomorea sp. BNER TaxID=2962031 RepID=UPI003AF29526|nr:DUF4030 domain-containing protein [Rossellomorea sp. BNER]
MKFLDEQFRELEEDLRITDKSKDQLRSKILQNAHKNKKRILKPYGWIAVAICMLFIITSPFYSSTMASIAEKIFPISITPSFSDGQNNPGLTSQLFELVEKEGYTVNSVGITPSPYTIEISLILKDSTLKQATNDLEPKITNYLYEKGYDDYELKVTGVTEAPQVDQGDETSLYDKVREIVKEVFASYGYAAEADYELVGLKKSWFSNIVTIEMPDHIQESTEIIADIEKEIESQNLDVKDIEVNTFNFEHRQQDNRWAYISSDIYDAMAGKSTYKLTGVSYKVKEGHSYVSIKTDLDKPPSEEIIQEIKLATQEYLALPETKKQIQNDNYTIRFLLNNGNYFVGITN